MHISYSSMNVFKQCSKKWWWKYEQGLEPIDQGPALKLGSIIHDAFYAYYNGTPVNEVTAMIVGKFGEEMMKVEECDVESIQIMQAIAEGMWVAFPKDLRNFLSILPEHPFVLNFEGMQIEGRLDGLVQTQDGKWYVREIKTTSLQQRQFKERVAVSEQADLYYWAARKMGFPVEGIVYDALRKPMLRKNQSESAQEFALRIRLDYKQRPEYYFSREYVYRTEEDIKNFEEDLSAFQTDLTSKRESKKPSFYRNHNSCMSFNSECAYKKICFQRKPDELTLNLFYFKKERQDAKAVETGTETS